MARAVDWDAGHGPVSGTLNAAYSALAVAAIGQEAGLPPVWALGASGVGALGSAMAGAAAEEPLSRGAILTRMSGWLAGGTWVSWALSQEHSIWSWSTIGPLAGCACFFASIAGAIGRKKRKQAEHDAQVFAALTRTRIGLEWSARIERVTGVKGCVIEGVEEWTDKDGNETGMGRTIEILMPEGGSSWRRLASAAEDLASDADLPEGCGIEIFSGASRRRAIMKVQLKAVMLEAQMVPLDASPLSFEEEFDIGPSRDGGLAMINIREFSAMLVGAKRTGKTNQLLAIITRLLRMPNLRVWVIDFNGGGVALQWLRAWDALGRPGRPPIDWVAADVDEAARMATAAVRVAKARKVEYQDLMAQHDTDLLPLSADIPGILIVTDEGAEVYANPKHLAASGPMKEVLRIAGASGVNQFNCFLRATADTTGDTIIKSQSNVRIGMKMRNEEEMSYLLGWRSGVTPQDMPDQGWGALSTDESAPSQIFRGWRVTPTIIQWFVENTVQYRMNESLDEVSARAAGEVYETRWERADYVFNSGVQAPRVQTTMVKERDDDEGENWSAGVDPEEAKRNLRKAIEDAGGPSGDELDAFRNVIRSGGLEDLEKLNPSNLPPESETPTGGGGSAPEPPDEESAEVEQENLRDIVFGMIKAMGPDGVTVATLVKNLQRQYGDAAPVRETVFRWVNQDDRVHKVGHGRYAAKPEENPQ